MPWLDADLGIDQSDWVVLSRDGWRAATDGDPTIWPALERKLLIGFHTSQPDLILIVGHESSDVGTGAEGGQDQVSRIVRRIDSLLLPTPAAGVWASADGTYEFVLEAETPEFSESDATLEYEPAT
jgi:hypothetical protein